MEQSIYSHTYKEQLLSNKKFVKINEIIQIQGAKMKVKHFDETRLSPLLQGICAEIANAWNL